MFSGHLLRNREMIYLAFILIVLYLVYKYDIKQHNRNKNYWYYFLLVWMIAVSGFAYNVGSDIPAYMESYKQFTPSKIRNVDNIFTYYRYQPGWIILNILCNWISSDFVVLKLSISIFLNCVIFWFIRRHSSSIFLSVFFYAILMYFDLNFNALRQAVAIGFFLIGYEKLIYGKWWLYLLYLFMGFMFHSSILFLFPVIILPLVRINKYVLIGIFGTLYITLFISLKYDVVSKLSDLLFLIGGDVTSEIDLYSNAYLSSQETSNLNVIGLIHWIFDISLYTVVVGYQFNKLKDTRRKGDLWIMILYIFLSIATIAVPIIFYRMLHYIRIFYVVLISDTIVEITRTYFKKTKILCYLMIFLISYYPIQAYFNINPSSQIRLIEQYAPYYSVFNKKISPIRALYFGYSE